MLIKFGGLVFYLLLFEKIEVRLELEFVVWMKIKEFCLVFFYVGGI